MRLDILIAGKKLARSRNVASGLIKKGLVKVNGKIISKPAAEIPGDALIEILKQPKYVGRGGLKLEKALEEFKIDPAGLIALDVGSSTGGFTDCLLQRGVKRVYAIDVGTGQFDEKLGNDPRIVLMEKTDIRNVEKLPLNSPAAGESGEHFFKKNVLADKPSLAVIDVSFISLAAVLPSVKKLIEEKGRIIALVKPQFETEKGEKNRRGVVKGAEIREKVLEKIKDYCRKNHLEISGLTDSPILGGSGNKEYLMLLQK